MAQYDKLISLISIININHQLVLLSIDTLIIGTNHNVDIN